MSEYYNKPPPGHRRLTTGQPRDPHEYFDGPVTSGRSARPTRTKRAAMKGRLRFGLSPSEQTSTAIVSADSVTGRSLTLVISIMCFLACLTVGAVYLINKSATAWLANIASEVTVQVEAQDKKTSDDLVAKVTKYLRSQKGISSVKPFNRAQSAALLEPWLGSSEMLKSLPIPRLIAVQLDRSAPNNLDALRANLTKRFTGAKLDDHRSWRNQIQAVTRSFALGGLAIFLLVGAATTAIIVSATRSAMASNREIVEVLHLVGATDRFIAREFERHFLRLGIKSGLVGAASSLGVFVLMPLIMWALGGGSLADAEVRRMFGSGLLDLEGYIWLGVVVIVIAALCMLTSRLGVYRILHAQQ